MHRCDQHARIVIGLAFILGLSACAGLMRSQRSGYADDYYESKSATSSIYEERQRLRENNAREELGWSNSRPLTENEQAVLNDRLKLKRLEGAIQTKREKRQYYQLKGLMRNDRERIYFLSLPTVEARERWAMGRGLHQADEERSDDLAAIIEKNDIILGMSQKSVSESWGDPDQVEVAGDPVYGNERWKYSRYISSNEGYQKENRIIYFEAGRVVGWESY